MANERNDHQFSDATGGSGEVEEGVQAVQDDRFDAGEGGGCPEAEGVEGKRYHLYKAIRLTGVYSKKRRSGVPVLRGSIFLPPSLAGMGGSIEIAPNLRKQSETHPDYVVIFYPSVLKHEGEEAIRRLEAASEEIDKRWEESKRGKKRVHRG